jgi:hypothetical protein
VPRVVNSELGTWCGALALAAYVVACSNRFESGNGKDAGPSMGGASGDAAPGTGAGGHVSVGGGPSAGNGGARPAGGAGGAPNPTHGGAGNGGSGDGHGGAVDVDAGPTGDAGEPDAPASYGDVVRADGPVAYWRMGIRSGRSVPDETGKGNDLVLQGTGHALGVAGAVRGDDGAIGFDGAASFAIATDARALDFADGASFTLECWARRASGGASYYQHLFSSVEGSAGDRNGYALYLLPEAGAQDFARSVFEYDRPAHDVGVYGGLGAEGAWTYYVAVYDGKKASVYVDGTFAADSMVEGSIAARTAPFTVARGAGSDGFYFKGALDELAVYPRALGLADVARHFDAAR